MKTMAEMRKITVEVPEELLENALSSTEDGITQTVRRGLELVAAGRAHEELGTQSCIDHDVRLVTRGDDFRPFARVGRLRLAL